MSQTPAQSPAKNKFWIRLAGTLLSLALLVFLLSRQGWADIRSAIQLVPLWRLGLALLLILLSRVATVGRWHVLLRSGGVPIRWQQSIKLTFVGLFAANFLPTTVGGDVMRLAGALQLGFDAAISTASLIADRLVGMAGMATVLPFGIGPLLGYVAHTGASAVQNAGIFGYIGRWSKTLHNKGVALFERLVQALGRWLKQPKSLFGSYLYTWGHMLCLFTTTWLLLGGMGQQVPWWTVAGLWSLNYFVTLLPVSINGLGLQELSITLIFARLGGAALESSLSLALLMRVLYIFASLPGALFIGGLLSYQRQSKKILEDIQVEG